MDRREMNREVTAPRVLNREVLDRRVAEAKQCALPLPNVPAKKCERVSAHLWGGELLGIGHGTLCDAAVGVMKIGGKSAKG